MVVILDKAKEGIINPDGFDNVTKFQMVPLRGTREVFAQTSSSPALFTFSRQNIALIANFRELPSKTPMAGSEPERFMNTFTVPANKKFQFTVKGFGDGFTFLNGHDTDSTGITFEADLAISVKPALPRKFCFVFVSDLVRATVRAKINPRDLLAPVKAVFKDQANVDLVEIDEKDTIRAIDVHADLEDPINLDTDAKDKVDARLKELFPKLFEEGETDFIVYVVWRLRGKHKQGKILGKAFQPGAGGPNTVYIGLEPTDASQRVHMMAHEFGHAMGLPHALKETSLMFPTAAVQSNVLVPGHIEQLHMSSL